MFMVNGLGVMVKCGKFQERMFKGVGPDPIRPLVSRSPNVNAWIQIKKDQNTSPRGADYQ